MNLNPDPLYVPEPEPKPGASGCYTESFIALGLVTVTVAALLGVAVYVWRSRK